MSELMRRGRWDTHLRPFIYNFRPGGVGNLAKWSLAKSKLKANGRRPKVIAFGDSKIVGFGAGTYDPSTTNYSSGAAPFSKTKMAADIITGEGVFKVNRQTLAAGQGFSTIGGFKNYDARVTGLSDWTFDATNKTMGGNPIYAPPPAVDSVNFAPEGTVDTIDVWYYRSSGGDTFTVKDGATTVDTINANGANALLKKTVALASRGSGKTISFAKTGTVNRLWIAQVTAYDSQVPAIDLINAGWGGSSTADWIVETAVWSPLNAIATHAADLYLIGLGPNDIRVAIQSGTPMATALAAYKANLITLANKCSPLGSVVLIFPSMGTTTDVWGDAATQAAFEAACYEVADTLDLPLINENGSFGGYVLANSQGKMSDQIHENAIGNWELAELWAQVMMAA